MVKSNTTQPKMTMADVTTQLTLLPVEHQEKNQAGQQILAWTEGHPILTAYVIELVFDQYPLFEEKPVKDAINHLVQDHFSPDLLQATNNSSSISSKNTFQLLSQIQKDLLAERPRRDRLLRSYREVLLFRHQVPSGYTDEQQLLLDIGLVVQDGRRGLKVANPIYRRVFNREWLEQYLPSAFIFPKEHWGLLIALLSIFAFALLQNTFRYLPIGETRNCSQEQELKEAIHANFSLNAQQMRQAIERLQALQQSNELTPSCTDILHDLEYNYAIYFEAGVDNQPFNAAKRLCGIPESYYKKNSIRPWFYRWRNLYKDTDFDAILTRYVQKESCPAYELLNSPDSF